MLLRGYNVFVPAFSGTPGLNIKLFKIFYNELNINNFKYNKNIYKGYGNKFLNQLIQNLGKINVEEIISMVS